MKEMCVMSSYIVKAFQIYIRNTIIYSNTSTFWGCICCWVIFAHTQKKIYSNCYTFSINNLFMYTYRVQIQRAFSLCTLGVTFVLCVRFQPSAQAYTICFYVCCKIYGNLGGPGPHECIYAHRLKDIYLCCARASGDQQV